MIRLACSRLVLPWRAKSGMSLESDRGCGAADLLLKTFRGNWVTTLHKPPPTPDMAAAPLQPLVAVVERVASASAEGNTSKPPPVKLAFKTSAAGSDVQQMQSVAEVLDERHGIRLHQPRSEAS